MNDPRTDPVTARIIFKGVMLMCINEYQQCEVGMIKCPVHIPKITIRELQSDGTATEDELYWDTESDLIFKVNNPQTEGVNLHQPGDDTDFSNVLDLEGSDFHDERLDVNKEYLEGRRLGLTAGTLYTNKLTVNEFNLVTWTYPNDPGRPVKNLGRIAEEVGLNILCRDEPGSGISILDSSSGAVIRELPSSDGTTYEIEVNNDCRRANEQPAAAEGTASLAAEGSEEESLAAPSVGSDFRFFYGVVTASDGRQFDIVEQTDAALPPMPSPGACEVGHLSQTNSLGVRFRP
jgi:hypothetical protein